MPESTTHSIERVELSGTPYERGVKHGELFSEEIETNVQTYLDRFAYLGATEEGVREQTTEFISLIEQENDDYAREMRGVAAGSGHSLEDITILNARWEVMYSALEMSTDGDGAPDGCTGFGVRPAATTDGHTYMGQNWDWIPSIKTFVMDIRQDDRPNVIALTEAGIVGGKIGLNEHGIGMTVNGLITPNDGQNPYRKPMHLRFQEALNATRLDGAVAPFITKDRAVSANVILGHEIGEFIDLELAPERVNYLYPADEFLTHANHFEGSDVDSKFEMLLPDTLCRVPRLRTLLTQHAGGIDVETLEGILRDHFNHPASICRHPNESLPVEEQYQTDGSFIIDLTEKRMFGTAGPPCESDYQEFRLAS